MTHDWRTATLRDGVTPCNCAECRHHRTRYERTRKAADKRRKRLDAATQRGELEAAELEAAELADAPEGPPAAAGGELEPTTDAAWEVTIAYPWEAGLPRLRLWIAIVVVGGRRFSSCGDDAWEALAGALEAVQAATDEARRG